jgi:hypothetical protein
MNQFACCLAGAVDLLLALIAYAAGAQWGPVVQKRVEGHTGKAAKAGSKQTQEACYGPTRSRPIQPLRIAHQILRGPWPILPEPWQVV